ncbi:MULTISPECIES: hypothetical protein [Bacillus]|jgi:hypothetical protein|uniref:hypothetical protein n=1 Tax=Bacillus TaxID=1386 RepID=UPI000F52C49C|nr:MULTISPECIES: hypothetical protein [Bacillus]MCK8098748.1 hypothetical protein [Bacillus sp. 2CMS4F]MEC2275444.1 hypothetical protein [Bacillus subtilis]NLS88031.1 hypothetical protein [Bacillus subtilis]
MLAAKMLTTAEINNVFASLDLLTEEKREKFRTVTTASHSTIPTNEKRQSKNNFRLSHNSNSVIGFSGR